jgi:hypothetical protein
VKKEVQPEDEEDEPEEDAGGENELRCHGRFLSVET